ncbi:hypothetical protein EWF20_05215 [Sulfolobus sp. S-194]|uniref:hypothetical protein n=1 Tax=Sulfolobus sp. S-194 TaxID=2512240 RepID=UPI001436FE58|nr:hypothetical protein [Sulfolobus sp. S-194]QIW23614.1 hypothetical protein EWF20_05215 [Sulfolobus sp. S-194]
MVCPYYKNNYCTSPLLPSPDDSVTAKIRCYENFKSCKFYVELGLKNEIKINFFSAVNLLNEALHSDCEYFDVKRVSQGYITYCKAINRVLTLSQAKNCVTYWQSCPFRQ